MILYSIEMDILILMLIARHEIMKDYDEPNLIQNLAEMLENVTDVHKRISDNTRKLLLNYFI